MDCVAALPFEGPSALVADCGSGYLKLDYRKLVFTAQELNRLNTTQSLWMAGEALQCS